MWAICVHPYGGGRFSEDNGRSALGRTCSHSWAPSGPWLTGRSNGELSDWWRANPGRLRQGSGLLPEAPERTPPERAFWKRTSLYIFQPLSCIWSLSSSKPFLNPSCLLGNAFFSLFHKLKRCPNAWANHIFRHASYLSHVVFFFLLHYVFRFPVGSSPWSLLPGFSMSAFL